MRYAWKPKYILMSAGVIMLAISAYNIFFKYSHFYINIGEIIFVFLGIGLIISSAKSDIIIKDNYVIFSGLKPKKVILKSITSMKEIFEHKPRKNKKRVKGLIIKYTGGSHYISGIESYDTKKLYPALEGMTGKKVEIATKEKEKP